jgi:hypothetical protein
MKAKDFDQKFEAGEDLTPYLDLSQAKRLGSDRQKRSDWLQYQDRGAPTYDPTVGTMITTHKFKQVQTGDFDGEDWKKEEWLIRSALVPIEQLHKAAKEFISPHYLEFEVGWDYQGGFQFGDYMEYGEIYLFPLISAIRHPVNQALTVDLWHEFLTYHALVKQNGQYYHPIDKIQVSHIAVDDHDVNEASLVVEIHRNYLRDYLAATKTGLLISVVADRFMNAATQEAFGVEETEEVQIDSSSQISIDIHPPEHTRHSYYRARSILRRSLIIEPYDAPLYSRNPWSFFGKEVTGNSATPEFIINDEGERRSLPSGVDLGYYMSHGIGQYGYLYFRPEVLQRFLEVPGYHAYFHMRNWGGASLPGDRGSIDVGINSQGLVNAFGPDIADLPIDEQAYWASCTSLPSGEVCEELFQTRMQQNPPHSPGVVDLFRNAREKLASLFKERFEVELFKDKEPPNQDLCKLSIGPITNQYSEVANLGKILYGWVFETMEVSALRDALTSLGTSPNKNLRQIKLLEACLVENGLELDQARAITAPLVGLNDLRVTAAHLGGPELEPIFNLMGASMIPSTPREAWNICVDSISNSLDTIADNLRAGSET